MEKIVDFLIVNSDSFYWALSVFVVFVLILFKFAIKPVVEGLDSRESKIRDEIKASEDALAKAQAHESDLDAKLKAAEENVATMLSEARAQAEEQKKQIIEASQVEAEQLRQRAQRDVEAAHAKLMSDVRAEMVDMATAVAGRVIEQQLDAAQHEQLILSAVDQMQEQG